MTRNNTPSVHKLALALGWFSIGLGLAQLFATRRVAKTVGVKNKDNWIRACGVREIANGVGIIAMRNRARPLWARVVGDVADLGLLGAALKTRRAKRERIAAAAAAVAGVTALDFLCSRKLHRAESDVHYLQVEKSVTIDRSAEELFQFWRNFENLPHFMAHLISVQTNGPDRSHWIVKGPAGKNVEWDAEIVREIPNRSIEWRSLDGADVDNSGQVRFEPAPGGRGTVVRVSIKYLPPAGRLGAQVAKLFGEAPEQQLAVDLRQFKQLMETGEVARTEGQPAARKQSTSKYDVYAH